jgi:hypothetical protein
MSSHWGAGTGRPDGFGERTMPSLSCTPHYLPMRGPLLFLPRIGCSCGRAQGSRTMLKDRAFRPSASPKARSGRSRPRARSRAAESSPQRPVRVQGRGQTGPSSSSSKEASRNASHIASSSKSTGTRSGSIRSGSGSSPSDAAIKLRRNFSAPSTSALSSVQ